MRIFSIFLILVALLLSGCSQQEPYSVQTLPSGKEVKIIGVTKTFFSESDPALILAYETDLPFEDVETLKQEVMEIWPTFKFNVEEAGLSYGGIQARKTTKTSFFTSTSKNYGFMFAKQESGSWILNENP